jgi:hypothetical protein
MNAIPDIFHFSIFCESHLDPKREAERQVLMHLLLRLDGFIKFSDVTFGQDPPDFVFYHQGGSIGVELTDLNPKMFEDGGNRRRADYKSFEAKIAQISSADDSFPWDKVSMRESLEAFKAQLEAKRKKAQPWFAGFTERWLLMNVASASGSPFGEILNGKLKQATPDMENAFADYVAKVTHDIYVICQDAHPFDHIILFRESDSFAEMLMFSPGCLNPCKLPAPSNEILNRGAKVSDNLLDRERTIKITIKKTSHRF